MAFKVFTSTTLTAADVNDYLAEQAVIVCTSGTRPTPQSGMTIFETDTDRVLVYDGTGWVIMSEPVQSYTPTYTNFTLGNGTVTANYHRSDGWCDVAVNVTLGSTSSVSSSPTISLPVTPVSGEIVDMMPVMFYDSSTGGRFTGRAYSATSTTVGLLATGTSGAYATGVSVAATAPFTWATGDILRFVGRYRMSTRYL